MIIISLTDCPPSLRGDLTRWLQEINTGVYVGRVSARIRDRLWDRVVKNIKNGRATMIFPAKNEQRMDFRVHNAQWKAIDFDGIKLMLRPHPESHQYVGKTKVGFSSAAKRRKARKYSKKSNTSASPKRYVVLDIETTGLSPVEDEIIEIAAISIADGEIIDQFQSLIKIASTLPQPIELLTGLTDDTLQREGRILSEVLKDLIVFVGDLPIVFHNADFDKSFLQTASDQLALPHFPNECIDSLSLARRLVKNTNDFSLRSLVKHFDLGVNELHRSLDDCLATKLLFEKLIEIEQMAKQ